MNRGKWGMKTAGLIIAFVVICILCQNYSFAEIDLDTCVAAWFFEDDSGKTVNDSSGKGNNGDVEGAPKWVDGKFGKGLDFNGAGDQVIVPDSDSLELANITMAAWLYIRSYPDDARIITQEVDGDPYSTYSLMMSGDGETKLEFRISLDNSRKRIPSNADIPPEKWTHVAATYDGSKAVIYINGEVDKEEPQSGELLTTDNPVYLGGSQFWVPRFFDGIMDEAVLFNVALSQEDIQSLMTNGLSSMLAVSSKGKLISTWAYIRDQL
jgi:hypothetical protein